LFLGMLMREAVPIEKKLLLSIAEACALSGLGRTTLYELISSGQLKSKTIIKANKKRGRRMIPRAALESFCKK
jgi:excisionase family DNA binding protein